jgi:hypothetical protein
VTSSKNTEKEPKGRKPDAATLEAFFETEDEDPEKDEALDSLSKQLEAAKDARCEERFLWIIVCVILVDVLWFRNAPNPTFPVVILVLEAAGLFLLANRMGVEEPKALFLTVIQRLTQNGS